MMRRIPPSFGEHNFFPQYLLVRSNSLKPFFFLCRMIVPSRWIRQWLLFAHIKAGPAPGPIDMWPLLKEDINEPGGWRPLKTLLPPCTEFGQERPGHYRYVIPMSLYV